MLNVNRNHYELYSLYRKELNLFMKKILFLSLFLFSCIFLASCSGEDESQKQNEEGDKLHVITTVYPLQFFTEEIGQKYVDSESIYPPGADEHMYEPSQKDLIQIADSDLFVYIGLGLEGFVNKAEDVLQNEKVTLLPAGESIKFEDEDQKNEENEEHSHDEHGDDEHHHGSIDPHVWLDPVYSIDLAKSIKDQLCELLPEHQKEFEANYEKLEKKLLALDKEFASVADEAKHKEFIVSHAAYGYWEKRYGIKQISISGLSTSSEPTQKELKSIIDLSKEHKLKYIYFEQNVSSELTKIVQEEINAQPLTLHNLSVLTENDIKNKRTYFSIMEDNLEALKKGLNE